MSETTTSQRARKRATASRLRAIYHAPKHDRTGTQPTHGHYTVYNLTNHNKYTVWYNVHRGTWECTCPTNSSTTRCKHVQRVLDREERRIRKEALADDQ